METKAPDAPPKYYDKVFSGDKYEGGRITYYRWALQVLKKQQLDGKGLDVGCGPGGFMRIGIQAGLNLEGLDFSSVAVEKCRERTNGIVHQGTFEDFRRWQEYQYFVILETLEHVKEDIALLQKLPPGIFVIGCVPAVKDPSHVRIFWGGPDEVRERYEFLFDNFQIEEVKPKVFGFYGWRKP